MEGMIDEPEPAFDIADMCVSEIDSQNFVLTSQGHNSVRASWAELRLTLVCFQDEDDIDQDETLTTSVAASASKGHHNLGSILEYRDLSAWRVSIPRLATKADENGKKYFIFVIEVQRIDITSTQDNADDLHWTVYRRYSEFYTLESRLTEFHGQFDDLHLPPKAKLFSGKGTIQKRPFEVN